MNHLEKIELIERYYFQQLSEQELQGIETLIKEDPLFKQEVEEYCNLYEGFDALHLENFSQQLQSFEAKITSNANDFNSTNAELPFPKTKIKLVWNKSVWSMAAAILLFVCCIPLLYNVVNRNTVNPEDFMEQSYAIIPMGDWRKYQDSTLTAMEKEKVSAKKEAFYVYNSKTDYQKSLDLFKAYESKYGFENQIRLYTGICNFKVGNYEEAINDFKLIIGSEVTHTDYIQESEYMLALIALKQNKKSEARALLDKVIGQSHHNYKKLAVDLAYELTK